MIVPYDSLLWLVGTETVVIFFFVAIECIICWLLLRRYPEGRKRDFTLRFPIVQGVHWFLGKFDMLVYLLRGLSRILRWFSTIGRPELWPNTAHTGIPSWLMVHVYLFAHDIVTWTLFQESHKEHIPWLSKDNYIMRDVMCNIFSRLRFYGVCVALNTKIDMVFLRVLLSAWTLNL